MISRLQWYYQKSSPGYSDISEMDDVSKENFFSVIFILSLGEQNISLCTSQNNSLNQDEAEDARKTLFG